MPSDDRQLGLIAPPEIARLGAVAAVIWRHRGRANAVRRDALARFVGQPDREVREQVAGLVREHGLPIAGSPRGGYYWIDDPDELAREARKLGRYVAHTAARMRRLVGSERAAAILGQLGLKLSEVDHAV
jgi:hypothetical protein